MPYLFGVLGNKLGENGLDFLSSLCELSEPAQASAFSGPLLRGSGWAVLVVETPVPIQNCYDRLC